MFLEINICISIFFFFFLKVVFLNNKEATLEILGRFTEELFDLQRAIRRGDGDQLFDYFSRTRAIRRGIIDAGQDTDAANFGRGDGSDEQ